MLYPITYIATTSALTVPLICAGVLGNATLAADLAVFGRYLRSARCNSASFAYFMKLFMQSMEICTRPGRPSRKPRRSRLN